MNFPVQQPTAGEWVSIFHARTRHPCEEQALVLKAMGVEHLLLEQPDGCHLMVPAGIAARAAEQLKLYQEENPHRPAIRWHDIQGSRGVAGAALFALFIVLAYLVQVSYALGVDWTAAGGLVAGEVRGGAWWRAVTALTLHADLAHVFGNLLFGMFFGYIAGQYLGSGVAWLSILLTGATGNVLNAFLQAAGHRSIGASTAVFAALGLAAACVWAASRTYTLSWARRWSPVVGAIALLAYTGTGDENTDIVAHLTGFLAGGAGGFLLNRFSGITQLSYTVQRFSGALAVGIIVLCWWWGLA